MTTTKTTKIRVSSGNPKNHDKMIFATILPKAAEPWFSIGDDETLRNIGKVLDTLPPGGSDQPQWSAAQQIAHEFKKYAEHEGAYAAEYNRCPSGYYAPGYCYATPVYNGRFGKWQFHLKLVATVGRTVEIFIGLSGTGLETRNLVVDFKSPSEISAGDVRRNFKQIGLCFQAD